MFKNEISRGKKVVLFTLLVILNLTLRIPSIPHEKGTDSFAIHSLSNSITSLGYANWWVHWLSVFGYYPYSYASAIPFSLSGISQLTGIGMENAILIFCIIMGLSSIFFSYLLAGLLYDDFLFKYLMALFYSISPGTMFFTTWEISSRGPFCIYSVLFIYLILKKLQYTKSLLLLFIVSIFLVSIHHLVIVLVPAILFFILIKLASRIKCVKIRSHYLNSAYTIGLITAIITPFFRTSTMLSIGSFTASRYNVITEIIITIIRYIGPMTIFILGGLVYLILVNNKKTNIWYIMCLTILFAPLLYNQLYGIYVFQLFLVFLLTVGFWNALKIKNVKSTKLITIFVVITLLLSVTFSAFYNHNRTGRFKDSWYMDEKTYMTGKWINDDVNKGKIVWFVSENQYYIRSVALQENGSSILTNGYLALTYGLIDKNTITNRTNLEKIPYTDSYFYSESPYRAITKDKFNSIEWYLLNEDIRKIKEIYNLDYVVQSSTYKRPIGFDENEINKICSNGVLDIYDLSNI